MRGVLDKNGNWYKALSSTLLQVWRDFSDHNGSQAAAAFSFYAFLSLIALVILAGAVLGVFLSSKPDLLDRIMNYISENMPGMSDAIKGTLDSSMNLRGLLGVVGILGLLFSGTKIFDSFQVWLNSIWEAEKPKYIKKKLKSLATLFFVGAVVALGFGVNMAIFLLHGRFSFVGPLIPILVFCLTAAMLFAGLCFVFAYCVEIKLGWRVVWRGALVAAVLINPIQMGLSWYYSNMGDFNAIYGSLAGVVLTVMVIYYVGFIIYLGAELNRSLDRERQRLQGVPPGP
jgi:membrane protein